MLSLSEVERETLARWARRRKTAQALALRSRIVLAAADGTSNSQVAADLGVTPQTVGKWRSRFLLDRLDGLVDEPRPGRPRSVSDEEVESVIAKTLEEVPTGATHWSSRSMAAVTGLSQSTVSRVWRAFGLQPHREETFKLSKEPLFVDKVRDVVGLYLDPPERAVVLCVGRAVPDPGAEPHRPGLTDAARHFRPPASRLRPARHHQSVRRAEPHHRPGSRLAARPAPGGGVHEVPQQDLRRGASRPRRAPRAGQLRDPQDAGVHRWLLRHPRFHLHFTPTSSSWLNLVERWLAELTTKKLQRGAHTSVRALEADIRSWIASWNDAPRPYVWTKTADQILDNLKTYCLRISDSGH